MFACFDDRGRLFVAESSGGDLYSELQKLTRKCRVSVLEDRDGDGKFERATIFADQLVFPMGLDWRGNKLYLADPPDLITLEDTNGDGRADKRSVVLSGFGHEDNGSLHGLMFGPDGWLYMTMGMPDGYRFTNKFGKIIQGKSGALIRCQPDGSSPEVVCRGFDNLVEIIFLPGGEIIGTDNWFQWPSGGIRDALVHLVEGGLYPRSKDVGTHQPVTGDLLPPVTEFPAVALSGLERFRGFTLPPEMRGNLFAAQHNTRKVSRHVLVRSNDTFAAGNFDFVTSEDPDFHPSDVLEDPDGSLLIIDTGGWYVQHCPTGKIRDSKAPGGIFRVRFKNAVRIKDPWGLEIDWKKLSVNEASKLLGDTRFPVREKAKALFIENARGSSDGRAKPSLVRLPKSDGRAGPSLVRHHPGTRGKDALARPQAEGAGTDPVNILAQALQSKNSHEVEEAIWALANIGDVSAGLALRKFLPSSGDLKPLAARALGRMTDPHAAPELSRLLQSVDAPTRLAAAEALASSGNSNALPFLFSALVRSTNRFEDHSLIHSIYRHGDTATLESQLQHSNNKIQRTAMLLLDQPPHQRLDPDFVLAKTGNSDPEMRRLAGRLLQNHPEWAAAALSALIRWLEEPALNAESEKRLLETFLVFQKNGKVQELFGKAFTDSTTRHDLKMLILRAFEKTNLKTLPPVWREGLRAALHDASLQTAALRTISVLQLKDFDSALTEIARDPQRTPAVRLDALRVGVSRGRSLDENLFLFLLQQVEESGPVLNRLSAVEILERVKLSTAQLSKLVAWHGERKFSSSDWVLATLAASLNDETASDILNFVSMALDKAPASSGQLANFLSKVPARFEKQASTLQERIQKNKGEQIEKLKKFEPLLFEGNPQEGRRVFSGQTAACAICHQVGTQGGKIGPDLTKIGAIRSGRDILESILFPSSTFAQGYENFEIMTHDGDALTGMIVEKSADHLLVREAGGSEKRLIQNEIKEVRPLPLSIMPEGLEAGLTAKEMRDLLAFLQSLK